MTGPYGYTPPADAAPQGGPSSDAIKKMIQDAITGVDVPLAFDGGDASTDTTQDQPIDFGGA